MKKSLALVLVVLLLSLSLGSVKAAQLYWGESLGGVGWFTFNDAIVLEDGSIVAVGSAGMERDNHDLLVVKFSPSGLVEWAETLGGPRDDYAKAVTVGPNGDLIVVGATKSFGAGNYDVWVVRLRPDGRVIWERTYGGQSDDRAMGVTIDNDGKIIVVGGTTSFGSGPGKSSDLLVMKLSGLGDVIWSRTYGRVKWDWGTSVVTDPKGYIYVGGTYWLGTVDYDILGRGGNGLILKLDPNGNLVWDRSIGDYGNDWIAEIKLLGKDVLFVGATKSFGAGDYDVWIGKLNESGNLEWVRTYGGIGKDVGTSLVLAGSRLIVGAYTDSSPNHRATDAWVLSLTDDGRLEWAETLGGPRDDYILGMVGYPVVAVGATSSFGTGQLSAWILKLPENGAIPTLHIKDPGFAEEEFKGMTYEVKPPVTSPTLELGKAEVKVESTGAPPKRLSPKVSFQFYPGKPPSIKETSTSSTSTTTQTTQTKTQSQTSSASTSTTSTASQTTHTTSSLSHTGHATTTPSPKKEKGGICGPGFVVLLALLAARRR